MGLTTVWFLIISFLWVGYFVLEGFDFGVGMLIRVIGRNDRERRVLISRYGLGGADAQTLEQLGRELGVTKAAA